MSTTPSEPAVATAHVDLEAAMQYPGNLADAVRDAARMLDLEEHRYVERFVPCPNGCEFDSAASMNPGRIAGPADCDLCFLGSYEDEDAPQINPLLGALGIAAAALTAVPAWVAPLVRHSLGETLDFRGADVPEVIRQMVEAVYSPSEARIAHAVCDDPACHEHGIAASNARQSAFYAANERVDARPDPHELESAKDWATGGQWRCICGSSGTTKDRPAADGHATHAARKAAGEDD